MSANDGYVQQQIQTASLTSFASADAEKAMIGCALRDYHGCSSYISELRDDDFYFDKHRMILRAVKQAIIERMDVNMITVDQMLAKIGVSNLGEYPVLLVECSRSVPSVRVAENYFRIVRELAVRRRAIKLVESIGAQLQDPTQDINAIMEAMRIDADNISIGRHEWTSMQDVMIATMENLEKRTKGEIKSVTTGISNIDRLIGGFFPGELTVIGARPAVGKSIFGVNVALKAAEEGFKVGVVSREMAPEQYGQRVLSYETRIDGMKLRKAAIDDDDWEAIINGMTMAGALPVSFLFSLRTIEDLRAEVQRKVSRGELDILIVDYLQIMQTAERFDKDHLRVGQISRGLKSIANDFKIPVIALAQVKRYAGGARAKMPTLEDLKDSGSIEQDADGIIFLHDPYDADDDYVDPRDKENFIRYREAGYTYLCIGVAKQRQGVTGVACTLLDKSTMHFTAIDRSWLEAAENA